MLIYHSPNLFSKPLVHKRFCKKEKGINSINEGKTENVKNGKEKIFI